MSQNHRTNTENRPPKRKTQTPVVHTKTRVLGPNQLAEDHRFRCARNLPAYSSTSIGGATLWKHVRASCTMWGPIPQFNLQYRHTRYSLCVTYLHTRAIAGSTSLNDTAELIYIAYTTCRSVSISPSVRGRKQLRCGKNAQQRVWNGRD